jgi:hypothetical protein
MTVELGADFRIRTLCTNFTRARSLLTLASSPVRRFLHRHHREGDSRSAIVFGLLSVTATATEIVASAPATSLDALRTAAITKVNPEKLSVESAIRNVYLRSEAVRR